MAGALLLLTRCGAHAGLCRLVCGAGAAGRAQGAVGSGGAPVRRVASAGRAAGGPAPSRPSS
ncbi:hypothetical protein NGM37_60525, partial [Streptomyces sp. TRM76130]|nr:hypothetical protein [Streptomyces sp. TRM76130]